MHIETDFSPFVKYKSLVVKNQLHNLGEGSSAVLSMLQYGEGYTDKSFAYLIGDYGLLAGYAYIEHFANHGEFGVFVHPNYRNSGFAKQLAKSVQQVISKSKYSGQPLDVARAALPIFKQAFGDDYPISDIVKP